MSERTPTGQFAPGNRAAAGRTARKVESWRRAFNGAVSQRDLREVVGKLTDAAKHGEPWAVKLLIERCLGPAESNDLLARLDALEHQIGGHDGR